MEGRSLRCNQTQTMIALDPRGPHQCRGMQINHRSEYTAAVLIVEKEQSGVDLKSAENLMLMLM